MAKGFVDITGTTSFPMFWEDGSFDAWNHYGVRGQPAAILVAPDGTVIEGWSGAFPEDTVIELAQNL